LAPLDGSRPTVRCTLPIGDWMAILTDKLEIVVSLSAEPLICFVV